MREQTKIKVGYVLDYVNDHIEQYGYSPSVREICAALGFKSTSTVHIYLKALEQEGKIIKSPSKPRTLRITRADDGSIVVTAPYNGAPYNGVPYNNSAPPNGKNGALASRPGQPSERQTGAHAAGVPVAGVSNAGIPAASFPAAVQAVGNPAVQAAGNPATDNPVSSNPAAGNPVFAVPRVKTRQPVYDADSVNREEPVYVPVIGRVTAGKPIFAAENIEYTFPVPSFFVNNASVFMLKVEGDSMINAGIHDRDYILVRNQPTAQNGEIVVALIDDEATVKTFYKERGRIRLQPENERYAPIYAANNCTVVGKVIGIFRKL